MKYIAIFVRKIGVNKVQFLNSESKKIGENKFKVSPKDKEFITYEKIKEVKFNATDETIDLEKDSFIVNIQAYSFIDKDKLYYYYDFDTHEIIGFETLAKYNINPKDLNKFTGRKTFESIVDASTKPKNTSILIMIIPIITLIAGLVIGYLMKSPQTVYIPFNSTSTLPTV